MAKPSKPRPQEVLALLKSSSRVAPHLLQRVWDAVLEEMLVLYYPPYRADDDVELLDQALVSLRAYVEDLVDFDGDVLSRGWRDVRRAHKVERWPTIEAIRSACLDIGRSAAPAAKREGNIAKPAHVERGERIAAATAAQMDSYLASPLGQRLRKEGLAGWLRSYVQREAHKQAQEVELGRRQAIEIEIPDAELVRWRQCRDSQRPGANAAAE